MKLLIPVLTFLFHLLELVAAVVVFPLTALCVLGLMVFTFHLAWRVRTGQTTARRVLAGAMLGSTA